MCCQWVRRGRKVTRDNPDARSPVTAFDECDRIAESHPGIVPWMHQRCSWSLSLLIRLHRSIHSKGLPTARRLLALPLQQQIQCRASGFVQS